MTRCNDCPYRAYQRMNDVVARKASLAVVGEAPSITEIRSGQLFKSPGGDMLKQTLRKVGLPDGFANTDIYFMNALNCMPPKVKGKSGINKECVQRCRTRVIEELKIVQPKLVLVFGNTAMQSVLNDSSLKITEQQGRVVECKDLPGVKIIPVIHPAKILHVPGEYKVFSQILTYAASVFNGTKEVLDPGTAVWDVLRTERDVQLMEKDFRRLAGERPFDLGCDIETTGLNPRVGNILTVGMAYQRNKVAVFAPSAFPYMNLILDNKQFVQTWHNGKFDSSWMRRRGYMGRVDHDIMLMHYCMNETSGTHDLEQLSQLYLGAQAYKQEANQYIKSKEGFASAPEQVLFERVAVDCDYTWQLKQKFYPMICNDPNMSKLYHSILIPASELLRLMERKGMLLDIEQLNKLREKYSAEIEEKIYQIQEEVKGVWNPQLYMAQAEAKTAPERFNPGSPKQAAWLIFDRLKLKPTKRKQRSTDEDVLLSLGESNDPKIAMANLKEKLPFIASILELRSIKKELSTYVEGMLDRKDSENRIHSTFSLHITATGRLSSKQPNVQNIPSIKKDVRKAFIAPPGHVLIETDYKGAELRVLAHMSGVGQLGQALIDGRDLHDDLSIRFWGPNFTKAQRMQAKTVNFGVPYGREAFSIAQEFGMEVSEAQGLIDEWFRLYPEAAAYLQQCADDAAAGKPLVTPFGRYRRFGLITPDTLHNIQNEARNFRIQSVSSDFTLISAIRIQPLIAPYKAHIIDLIHDSILVECPEDPETVKIVSKIVSTEMSATPIRELNCVVPFGTDIEIGKTWGTIQDIKAYEEYKDYDTIAYTASC